MTTRHTSCRAILAGAATIPLAAVASSPVLAEADDAEQTRLLAEVKAAYDGLGDAIQMLGVAEGRLFQWRAANPEPDKDDGMRHSSSRSVSWLEWLRREIVFQRESGCDEAYAAEGAAHDKLTDAINALRPARTIRGLVAKARLIEIDRDCLEPRISILDDLLALDAGHA